MIFCGRERPRGVDGENCDIKAASDDTSADLRDMSLDTAYVRRIAGRDVENCLPPGGPRRQTEPALPLTGDARSTRVATSSSAAIRWPRRVDDQPPAVRIGGKRSMLASGGGRRRGPKVSVASGSVKVRATRSVTSVNGREAADGQARAKVLSPPHGSEARLAWPSDHRA